MLVRERLFLSLQYPPTVYLAVFFYSAFLFTLPLSSAKRYFLLLSSALTKRNALIYAINDVSRNN